MRTLCVALGLAAALVLFPRLNAADEPQSEPGQAGTTPSMADLQLTDEQESKIADIRKECGPKVQEAAKELGTLFKEEVDKVRAVLTPEQKEKLQAYKDERREHRTEGLCERIAHLRQLHLTDAELTQFAEIRKEFHPRIVKAMEGLRGILTDEQKKAHEEALKAGKNRKEVWTAVNLTGEQKEKVEAVCKDLATVIREEMEKMADVLTESQKEKLAEFSEERHDRARDWMAHRIMNYKELNLTDDQKKQITDIRMEYRPKIHEAGNKVRTCVREEVGQILAVLKG
jgi:Spy/CpxP family protein refolding chaperone